MSAKGHTGPTRAELEDLYRVRVDQIEPNNLDLTKMYQDCVPTEAKILEDFLNNQKKDKDSKDSANTVEDVQKGMEERKLTMLHLFPPDAPDWKEISDLQRKQFEAENGKYGT